MTNLALQKKAVEVVIIVNAAVANTRLYPPTSDIIGTSIGRLDNALKAIFNEVDSITFSESERVLLISGQALNEKDQQRPQVVSFLEMLRNIGVKSITIEKEATKDELLALMEIIGSPPEKIIAAGGIKTFAADKNLTHVSMDEKIYMAMGKGQKVTAEPSGAPPPDELNGIERRSGVERRTENRSAYAKRGGTERRGEEDRRKIDISDFKEKLAEIIQGKTEPFKNKQVIQVLPATIQQLFSKEKNKIANALIDRLVKGLLDANPDIRDNASKALSSVGFQLMEDQRLDGLRMLLDKLIGGTKQDAITRPAFEQVCGLLRSLLPALIQHHYLEESFQVLKAFKEVEQGRSTQDESLQEIAGSVIREIVASDDFLALIQEMQAETKEIKDQAAACLAVLGSAGVEPLLDLLQENPDKSLQALVTQVLIETGPAAAPQLALRIEANPPAETLRFLVAMIGKIGSEADLEVLIPLVQHEDVWIQREALNGIFAIGGDSRGRVLLSLLLSAGEQLKPGIIGMLGVLKYQEAVPALLEMLENKSLIASKSKNELAEKICIALGKIGAEEAIPALTAIAEPKGLLKIKTYSDSVKAAAKEALSLITA